MVRNICFVHMKIESIAACRSCGLFLKRALDHLRPFASQIESKVNTSRQNSCIYICVYRENTDLNGFSRMYLMH